MLVQKTIDTETLGQFRVEITAIKPHHRYPQRSCRVLWSVTVVGSFKTVTGEFDLDFSDPFFRTYGGIDCYRDVVRNCIPKELQAEAAETLMLHLFFTENTHNLHGTVEFFFSEDTVGERLMSGKIVHTHLGEFYRE